MLLPLIKRAVGSFHSSVARSLLPTPVEVNRGLMIERCFDFYDPTTRQIRTLRMAESAVHTREAVTLEDCPTMGKTKSARKRASIGDDPVTFVSDSDDVQQAADMGMKP